MSLVEQIQSGFGKVAETFKSKANKSDLTAGSSTSPIYIDSDGKAHEVNAVSPLLHLHAGSDIVLTGYEKANEVSAVVNTDDVNAAIGKIEKALDNKQDLGKYITSINGLEPDENGNINVEIKEETATVIANDLQDALKTLIEEEGGSTDVSSIPLVSANDVSAALENSLNTLIEEESR